MIPNLLVCDYATSSNGAEHQSTNSWSKTSRQWLESTGEVSHSSNHRTWASVSPGPWYNSFNRSN